MNSELPDGIAVSVDGVSKRYRLRPRPNLGGRPRFAWRTIQGPGAGVDVIGSDDDDDDDETIDSRDELDEEADDIAGAREIWALRDVSFKAPRGSILGVAGPHGAGKTTLLRILGRTTPPTSGRATIGGRVSPPVEAALRFFEPERTGRRNVLTVAEIFGVPRDVALAQLDEIFVFADLMKLRDVEMVRYSRGFTRRLAFSAVLNLMPDVLLADGLPGMGDAEFRERSLERIMARRAEGMTVIMATSDSKLLRRVCDHAIWLENGRLVSEGSGKELAELHARPGVESMKRTLKRVESERDSSDQPADPSSDDDARPLELEAVSAKQDDAAARAQRRALARQRGGIGDRLEIAEAGVCSPGGEPVSQVRDQDEARVRIRLMVKQAPVELRCTVVLRRGRKRYLRINQPLPSLIEAPGEYEVSVPVPAGSLNAGSYSASVGAEIVADGEHVQLLKRQAFLLEVEGTADAAQNSPRVRRLEEPWSINGPFDR